MSYGTTSSRYLEMDVRSRQTEWLIPLMYEHLISNLRRASAQMEAGDIEGKAASLDRASAILMELIGSLDFERGGEIASRLSALYAFFATELIDIGRTMDTERMARLIAMIGELHEAWEQAAESVAPRTRSAGASAGPTLA